MSDQGGFSQLQVNTILIVVDLILTAVVAVVTTMRFRAKCGNAECACKPKDTSRSPGSMTSSPTDNAVAIVMSSPAHQQQPPQ
jgi:hypothetical protein